ncbi:hypothetical protein LEP1GSC112_2315 [Leptospira interrogans serovar Pomona str. UT364]|nr:hypothetical protein LEP1GSC087_1957 [Leptospira interrogans serovar Bataviae str. L1111]EMN96141.1 hypothetical protein LEP1GSC110_3944 [Leptospira interrogans serovar Medanensis str. UT053]EMN99115.1 hypothetical protein LEP1GSC112_2315 [Leptospira interrogans serovar Pomona str. UT364]
MDLNLFVFCLSAHKSGGSFFRVCLEENLNLKKERIFYTIN